MFTWFIVVKILCPEVGYWLNSVVFIHWNSNLKTFNDTENAYTMLVNYQKKNWLEENMSIIYGSGIIGNFVLFIFYSIFQIFYSKHILLKLQKNQALFVS